MSHTCTKYDFQPLTSQRVVQPVTWRDQPITAGIQLLNLRNIKASPVIPVIYTHYFCLKNENNDITVI